MEKDIMKEFYHALEENRIKPYFQPQYTTNGFDVAACEALCRMELKDGTIIMPEKYIPTLEGTGEICSLDWHILIKVCWFLSRLRFWGIKPVPVAVNFSSRHSEEWDTAEHLSSIVDSYGIDHELIEVEITETYKPDEYPLQTTIDRIRDKGFSVAIDDFGKGYSSFGLIKNIHFDKVKIDKSFIKDDCEDFKTKAMIESIIKMSERLGAKTVVEGVENAKQLSYLNCCGCDLLQGDYLGEPMKELRFLDLLNTRDKAERAYAR